MSTEFVDKLDQILLHLANSGIKESQLLSLSKKKLLNTGDMMLLFHNSRRSIERWRKKGILPHVIISRNIYFIWEDVLPMLKSKSDK